MPPIEVTRTYLEMTTPGELRPAPVVPELKVERVEACPISFFRYLYREVGRPHRWTDRLDWTDDRIREHLAGPVFLWVGYEHGAPAGYFELRRCPDESVEIAYFGLLPEYVGRGRGKYLLTRAVEEAWALGATRVWLHTCTLDHPAALPNYLRRGFRPTGTEVYQVEVP